MKNQTVIALTSVIGCRTGANAQTADKINSPLSPKRLILAFKIELNQQPAAKTASPKIESGRSTKVRLSHFQALDLSGSHTFKL